MLRFSILFSVLLIGFKSFAQGLPPCPLTINNTLTASPDTVICNSGCATLWAQGTTNLKGTLAYSEYSIPYAPQPYIGPNIQNFSGIDDSYGDLIQIPFPFCFFGLSYTQLTIGANGEVSFNTGQNGTPNYVNGPCPFPISQGLPGNNNAGTLNCIMAPYYDLAPFLGGTISTGVYGVAPCRMFVVSWSQVQLYNNGQCPGMQGTQQIIIYESTNAIDINIQNKPQCNNWNQGRGIVGIEDNIGTTQNVNFYVPPGRNGVPFSATNESWRYLPNSVPLETYIWRDSATNAVVGNGQTVTVCPTVATTYIVEYRVDACPVVSLFDTIRVTMGVADSIEYFVANDPSICGSKDGSVVLSTMVPGDTFIVNYQHNGIPQPPITVIVAGDSSITIPGLDTGTYTNMYITTVTGCESNRVGPAVLVNPAFSVGFDTVVTFGCETDQVQFLDQSVGVTQYAWDFGDGTTGSTASPLHIYQDQGVYNVTLIGTNGFCTDLQTMSVPLVHPLDAQFSISEDSICNGEFIVFSDNSVVSFDSSAYEWNFGDGATSVEQNTVHQYTTDGIFTASLTVTDYIGCVSVETKQIVVASLSIEIGPKDTSVCLVDSTLLYSQSFYPPYFSDGITYSWSPDDNIGSPNSEETYYYNEVPGDYYYVLTATGYPMECVAKDTLHIHIQPRPVLVNVTPNTVIKYGEDIQLSASGVQYYIWTPPATLNNPNISTPIGSPREPVVYSVYGMNEHGGCRDTAQVEIGIDYTMEEFIPSVFSPNGDGKNDLFRIVNLRYQKLVEFRVFNRWGKEVYNYTDGSKGWDGTYNGAPQDPGVYTYIIRVNVPDGDARVYKGNITLIR